MIRRFLIGSGAGSPTASKLIVRRARITDGSGATLPNTAGAWQPVSGFALAIPAVVGDDVIIGVHGMRSSTASAYLDIGVVVGGSIARFMATGTSTPPAEGDPGWYISSSFIAQSAPRGFTVASGDLSGGNVTFAVVCNAGGTGTVYASSTYDFYWEANNRGQVD